MKAHQHFSVSDSWTPKWWLTGYPKHPPQWWRSARWPAPLLPRQGARSNQTRDRRAPILCCSSKSRYFLASRNNLFSEVWLAKLFTEPEEVKRKTSERTAPIKVKEYICEYIVSFLCTGISHTCKKRVIPAAFQQKLGTVEPWICVACVWSARPSFLSPEIRYRVRLNIFSAPQTHFCLVVQFFV